MDDTDEIPFSDAGIVPSAANLCGPIERFRKNNFSGLRDMPGKNVTGIVRVPGRFLPVRVLRPLACLAKYNPTTGSYHYGIFARLIPFPIRPPIPRHPVRSAFRIGDKHVNRDLYFQF